MAILTQLGTIGLINGGQNSALNLIDRWVAVGKASETMLTMFSLNNQSPTRECYNIWIGSSNFFLIHSVLLITAIHAILHDNNTGIAITPHDPLTHLLCVVHPGT